MISFPPLGTTCLLWCCNSPSYGCFPGKDCLSFHLNQHNFNWMNRIYCLVPIPTKLHLHVAARSDHPASKGVEFLKKMINKNEINNNYYSFINSQTKLVFPVQYLTRTGSSILVDAVVVAKLHFVKVHILVVGVVFWFKK